MVRGFWDNLKKPIVGLAPMDGVTDAAFRYMVCKHGRPSVMMTEFTNVEGLARGAAQMLVAFLYNEIERPVVAQIFGVEVDSYYKTAVMLCAMGFDGIDINMGCPATKVAKKGSGAALIKTPELAKEIIRSCQKGCKDWAEGISLEKAGVHENIIETIKDHVVENSPRKHLPVSVKTRIGYEEVVTEEWTKHLLEVEPANITMHGRTLRQLYRGEADWEEIAKAADICRGSGTSLLGNGDVDSMKDAEEKTEKYGVDGVLVGRATFGTPWFFGGEEPENLKESLDLLIEHAEYFEKLNHLAFHNIRKHLAWYCKGFEGAKELRMALMHANNSAEVKQIICQEKH